MTVGRVRIYRVLPLCNMKCLISWVINVILAWFFSSENAMSEDGGELPFPLLAAQVFTHSTHQWKPLSALYASFDIDSHILISFLQRKY